MYRIGNFLIFLLALPLVVAFWVQGVIFLGSLPNPQALVWFFIGMAGMLLVCILLHGIELNFTETATHEMLHALAGEPFMGEPASMHINIPGENAGQTEFNPPMRGAFWVAIAPYSFPVLAIPPLVLRLLPIGQTYPASWVAEIILGAALAFHYHCIWMDFGSVQTDLTRVCTLVGFVSAMTFQLVFLIIALSAVMGIPQLIGSYFWAVWERTWDYYGLVFGWFSEAWATATQ